MALPEWVARSRTGRVWWGGGGVLFVAAYLLATFVVAQSSLAVQGLILVAAIFALLALGLDLVAGAVGLYSLGHAGLFAIGAYTTTILANDDGTNLFVLLPISIATAGLVGLILGALSLRISGLYFSITTFVFTLIVTVLATDLSSITGGPGGLVGPAFPSFPAGLRALGSSVAWCIMLALFVVFGLMWSLRKSPLYPVLLTIRDAEPFAEAAGVRTALVRIGVFGLSAAMAGLAGWAFAFQGVVSPGQFDWSVSVNVLVMVILGGINTLLGPIIGAAFVSIFPAYVNLSPFWQEVLFGGIFVFMIVVCPQGLVGIVSAMGRRWNGAIAGRPSIMVPTQRPREAAPLPDGRQAMGVGSSLLHERRPANDVAVECRGVAFCYGQGPRVLTNVDLVVKRGTIHGLIGPNGSGKSTLVDLIAGRRRPEAGTIEVNGQRVEKRGPLARAGLGLRRTFQTAVLVGELPCRENVVVGLYSCVPRIAPRAPFWPLLPSARADSRRMGMQASEALSFVGAAAWGGVRVADVPHGVEQVIQLAAACAPAPNIVVLDEPLAGLSPGEVEHMGDLLSQLQAAGITVILIEHQTRFVFSMCDQVTVLDAGEVVAAGSASEVRANRRVREVYLGR
jgi:branched-chain amino acid transport system permease protein